jgi:hypothetical protein
VTLVAAIQLLFVHVGVTAFALGVDRVTQRRRVPIGLFTMTLVARARLGLDILTVVTIGAARSVHLRMVVMAVDEFAQFGMVTLSARFSRQIFLVISGELGIELSSVT